MGQDTPAGRSLNLYLYMPMVAGALLLCGDLYLLYSHRKLGLLCGVVWIVYMICAVLLYRATRKSLRNAIRDYTKRITYAQKRFHEEMPVPYALMTSTGTVIWMNHEFQELAGPVFHEGYSIRTLFPRLTADLFPEHEEQNVELELNLGELELTGTFVHVDVNAVPDTEVSVMESELGNGIIAVYLRDDTEFNDTIRQLDEEEMVVGLIYIDNYDEMLDSVDELRQSLMIALIDREVTQYIQSVQGVAKKLEQDKYFVVFKNRYLDLIKQDRFSLLNDIKKVRVADSLAPTASIGLGLGGSSYAESYRFARSAIELALGRGGDQAIIKNGDEMTYYGGKKELPTTNSHVKARAKADALRDFLISKEHLIVMGHKLADVDSFGAAMGIFRMARTYGKEVHIVIDEVNISLAPLLESIRKEPKYPKGVFISSEEALKIVKETDMLVVVDTSRPSYTMCPELLDKVKTVVVIDHHRRMQESISGAALSYIEPNASSASEMVAEIMQYIREDIKPWPFEADALYAGIIIDTNNFSTKTGARTFEAAAYLRRCGADIAKIRKVFRDDVDSYKAKAETIRSAEIYRDAFAIARFPDAGVSSPTIIGAQAANEMLNINNIKASFVLTLYKGTIYVSARSIDEVNVQLIMERLGGGGHMSTAGAQFHYADMDRAVRELKSIIDVMIKEGNIE